MTSSIVGRVGRENPTSRAVAVLPGRERAAREVIVESAGAPQFLGAARRCGDAGLMPAGVIVGVVPEDV